MENATLCKLLLRIWGVRPRLKYLVILSLRNVLILTFFHRIRFDNSPPCFYLGVFLLILKRHIAVFDSSPRYFYVGGFFNLFSKTILIYHILS